MGCVQMGHCMVGVARGFFRRRTTCLAAPFVHLTSETASGRCRQGEELQANQPVGYHRVFQSGRPDLNRGPPAPEAGAITGLRYAPYYLVRPRGLEPLTF